MKSVNGDFGGSLMQIACRNGQFWLKSAVLIWLAGFMLFKGLTAQIVSGKEQVKAEYG